MSCSWSGETLGASCKTVYQVVSAADQYPGYTVPLSRAQAWYDLGKSLGLTEFNPTTVDWDHPYLWKATATGGGALMSQGAGYALLFSFGIGLTLLTLALSMLEKKFANVKTTSEQFNTAGREIKTGLTASVIVSQWTWAATLLQSSNVAWQYGITGPFWYASGASIQVLIFGILAIEVKRRAPNAHTFLEMVNVRWGKTAHFVFLFFGLATNIIVSSMLLLGGCSVMSAVADIDIHITSFIIPCLTLLYTFFGGLKATFLASYVHTTIIFLGLMTFVTVVYGYEIPCLDTTKQCNSLGSASVMWERLQFMTALPTRVGTFTIGEAEVGGFHQGPAFPNRSGNRQGTYLTMMSQPGLMFGIINIVGNFGTVFVDQSYWQSAIAASPASAHKGYLLGGLVWFTIPFALATSLGLAGNALNVALTSGDAGSGLVPPASAITMIGPMGGIIAITMLIMAIVSTGSAECIAVASLWAYDVYRTYLNPNATGKDILFQSRIVVCVWALVMALASIVLYHMGLNLGWVYNFMGIMVGSAVVPISCVILTDALDSTFAIAAAVVGNVAALIMWIVSAQVGFPGEPFLVGTGSLHPQLNGNLTAILSSLVICIVGCIVKPMNFDWEIMRTGIKLVAGDGGENANVLGKTYESSADFLLEAKKWIVKYGWGWTIFLTVIWPCLCIPAGNFGKSFYQVWASIALMWGWVAGLTIIFLPLWESRDNIMSVLTCKPIPASDDKASEVAGA